MPASRLLPKPDTSDDIEDWMTRRRAELGQFLSDAEAAGRKAWNDATRAGQDLAGRTQSELAALGAQKLRQDSAGSPARNGSKPFTNPWADPSSPGSVLGLTAAEMAGNVAGLGRGAWHSVKGLGQSLLFASRLIDPDDAETSGANDAAWGQVFNAPGRVVGAIRQGVADPGRVAAGLQQQAHRLYVDTVPEATPAAPTYWGELRRNFDLGQNEGELYWDVGSLLFGAAGSKAFRAAQSAEKAVGPAKFLDQGFSPTQAAYLAEPYEGMGHHFVPTGVAKKLGIPRSIRDSKFNVLQPQGISRGDFYELHYKVDPDFRGTKFPADVGGGRWRGKALGLQKYGPWSSIWHGSPAPLNAVIGVSGIAAIPNYEPTNGDAHDDR